MEDDIMKSKQNNKKEFVKYLKKVQGVDVDPSFRFDVHIKRIREKISAPEGWGIKTVWGIGYKFEVKE